MQPSNLKLSGLRKIFYLHTQLLSDVKGAVNKFQLVYVYHPGKQQEEMFITDGKHRIMEVLEFTDVYRSWLVNSNVCSNGSIYLTAPIDATFIVLHKIRKHCMDKALSLDHLYNYNGEDNFNLSKICSLSNIQCVADVKIAGDEKYYKYNAEKALAWLTLKTKKIARILKESKICCTSSAFSRNFKDDNLEDCDRIYLNTACELVGNYIDLKLYQDLACCLGIPLDNEPMSKRKSTNSLDTGAVKKIKTHNATELVSVEDTDQNILQETKKLLVSKERPVTTKAKALAKSARGTKSITSFFKQ